jgi:hypothetical protein
MINGCDATMTVRNRAAGVAISALAVLVGCGSSGESAPPRPPIWTLESEIRIDGHEHDFVHIHGLDVSSSGVIAITQSQDRNVRLFDNNGRPVASIGRGGQGPGEFEAPLRLGWIGDSIWIYDTTLRRVTIANGDGEFIEVLPAPPSIVTNRPGPWPFAATVFHADGSFTGVFNQGPGLTDMPIWRSPRPIEPGGMVYARVSSDHVFDRNIARSWLTSSFWSRPTVSGGSVGGTHPFPNAVKVALDSQGTRLALVIAELEESPPYFRAVMLNTQGDTLYDRRYSFESMPIDRQTADSAIESTATLLRSWDARAAAGYASYAYIPPAYPPVERAIVGYEGSLWLRLHAVGTNVPYLVLDASGEPIGRLTVPVSTEIVRADDAHVWTLETDAFDVQSVLRYRIFRE